jgi:hypothetical protein
MSVDPAAICKTSDKRRCRRVRTGQHRYVEVGSELPKKAPRSVGPKELTVAAWKLNPERDDAVLEVVGEGSYQANLRTLGGRSGPDGPANTAFVAGLVRDPANRYDENAIAVRIDGRLVGYLSREDAIRYRPVVEWAAAQDHIIACDARLTGGWDNGRGDQGHTGAILHVGTPGETLIELREDEFALRTEHAWPGWMVAFTGDSRYAISGVPLDRECAALLARRAGLIVHPRVTKKVQLLVDCDPAGASGNELKAHEYGIPVITEGEFWVALGVPVEQLESWGRRPEWQRR